MKGAEGGKGKKRKAEGDETKRVKQKTDSSTEGRYRRKDQNFRRRPDRKDKKRETVTNKEKEQKNQRNQTLLLPDIRQPEETVERKRRNDIWPNLRAGQKSFCPSPT